MEGSIVDEGLAVAPRRLWSLEAVGVNGAALFGLGSERAARSGCESPGKGGMDCGKRGAGER
jgi:hypothetical protein